MVNSQNKIAVASASVLMFVPLFLGGCVENVAARIDREEAQAKDKRPISTEVAVVNIPHDPTLPIWVVVVVEPFVMGASGVTSGPINPMVPTAGVPIINPGEQIGSGVAAQLVTSLRRVGNIVVIDYDTYQRDPDKIINGLRPGEQGPFVIKGTVTEFSEMANVSGQGKSTGPNFGLSLIPFVGGIVAHGYGTKSNSETKHIGMVGIDIQIVDSTTGRLVTSFTAEGSFTSISATKSRTTWGNTKTSTEYASSAIGQAQRIALNKTIAQIHSTLTSQ